MVKRLSPASTGRDRGAQVALPYVSRTLTGELAAHPDRSLPWLARIDGTMVMADISGFTSLSEGLAVRGKEGAEQLTDIINSFFADLIDIAEQHGGDTLTFGGDAVLLLFSGSDHAPRAVKASLRMLRSVERMAPYRLGRDRIKLGMSMGAHSARFAFIAAGSEHKAHFLALGTDAAHTAAAESSAGEGDLVVSDAAGHLLGDEAVLEPHADGLWRVRSLTDEDHTGAPPVAASERDAPVDTGLLIPYLPSFVADALRSGVTPLALGGEHRRVTVVFANVSGVDRLLGEPDPSVPLAELQTYFAEMFGLLARRGGTLVSSDVDADGFRLIVAFGAPVAREHDAESAARFVLEMRDLVSRKGLSLTHRFGVHRANVYAGDVGSASRRQYTVMGDGVNLAARLMSHASSGTVVVPRELIATLGESFRCDDLGTVRVKGKSKPIAVCELAEEVSARTAGITDAVVLPLLGRERELGLISGAIEQARCDSGHAVLLAGEPGIGKSRLMTEGIERARAAGWRVLQGACYEHMSATPYGPWLPVLEQLLELDSRADADTRSQALTALVDSLAPELKEQTPLLGPLLGVELAESTVTRALGPTSRRRSLFDLVATLFRRAAARELLAVAIEDVHWADESSLDLLEAVASAALGGAPLLVLLSCRPAGLSRLRMPPQRTTAIDLTALPRDAATRLVEQVTGVATVPEALSELLVEKTAGNPLFLEEVARSLRQSGVFDQPEVTSGIAAAETISKLDFPDRVQTLLMARVDGLDASARETLRHAAVVGQVFDVDTLAALEPMTAMETAHIAADLDHLEELEFLTSSPAGGGTDYRFRHALVQEVAYASLRFDRRRELHLQLATYLETRWDTRDGAHLDQVTHHYRRSGDRQKTFEYALHSAAHARGVYANRESIDYYRIALDSENSRSPGAAGVRSALLEQVGDTLRIMGLHRDAIHAYQDALRRWRRTGNRTISPPTLRQLLPDLAPEEARQATLCHKIAICYEVESRRYDRADYWVAEALSHLPEESSSLPAHIYSTQGTIRMRQGRYISAIRSCERAAAHARGVKDDSELAWALNTLSACYAALGYLETAISLQERSVNLLRKLGDLRRLSSAFGNLANCHMEMGDMEQALSYNRDALAIETRIGSTDGAAATNANIGEIEVTLGHFEEAIGYLESTLETSRPAGWDGLSGFALMHLSRAYVGAGDLGRARASIDEGAMLLARSGVRGSLAEAIIQQADVTRLEGNPDEALVLCAPALRDLSRIGERMPRVRGLRVKGEALAAIGDRRAAVRALDDSAALAREMGASSELALSLAAREALEAVSPPGSQ